MMKKQYKKSLLSIFAVWLVFMCISSYGLENKAPWILVVGAAICWGLILRLLFLLTRDTDIKPGMRKFLRILFWFLCYCAGSAVIGSAVIGAIAL